MSCPPTILLFGEYRETDWYSVNGRYGKARKKKKRLFGYAYKRPFSYWKKKEKSFLLCAIMKKPGTEYGWQLTGAIWSCFIRILRRRIRRYRWQTENHYKSLPSWTETELSGFLPSPKALSVITRSRGIWTGFRTAGQEKRISFLIQMFIRLYLSAITAIWQWHGVAIHCWCRMKSSRKNWRRRYITIHIHRFTETSKHVWFLPVTILMAFFGLVLTVEEWCILIWGHSFMTVTIRTGITKYVISSWMIVIGYGWRPITKESCEVTYRTQKGKNLVSLKSIQVAGNRKKRCCVPWKM